MLKRLTSYIICTSALVSVDAQDIHFSQTNQVSQFINPALVGHFDGWERVNLAHRQQWTSIGSPFVTSGIGVDLNFFKQEYGSKKAHMGVGLIFNNDIAGDAKLGTNQGVVSLSAIVPIAENHTLSAGIQGGIGQRSGNINNLTWGNQFNGDEFDAQIPSGEANSLTSLVYPDFGLGLNYTFENLKSNMVRKELMRLNVGFAYHHFNKPEIDFYAGNTGKLFAKLVAHTSFHMDIPNSLWAFEPSASYFSQGPYREIYGGLLAKYRLKQGTKYTGINKEGYFCFGSNLRFNDAIIPVVAFEMGNYRLGVSYDVVISQLQAASRMQGGFEITFQWINMKDALFKRRRGQFGGKGGSGA
ncbi:MAG: PorP/SprF family type IX secretion system membrane protein [Flavobacteriales bacterium]